MSRTHTYGGAMPDAEEISVHVLKNTIRTDGFDDYYIGNDKTKVYHDRNCFCIQQIKPDNIEFVGADFKDNKGKEYRACSKCLAHHEPKINDEQTVLEVSN